MYLHELSPVPGSKKKEKIRKNESNMVISNV